MKVIISVMLLVCVSCHKRSVTVDSFNADTNTSYYGFGLLSEQERLEMGF